MWDKETIAIAKLSGYSDKQIQDVIDEEKESIKVKDKLSSSKGENNLEDYMDKVCNFMLDNKIDFTIESVLKGYRIEVFQILDEEVETKMQELKNEMSAL